MKIKIILLLASSISLCAYQVDFDAAMGKSHPQYDHYYRQGMASNTGIALIKQLRELYNNSLDCFNSPSQLTRIPKKIHQIWLGSPLPEKFKLHTQSWQHHHPDWEYILWTDADIARLHLENQKAYDTAINYGERSDIARYEILHRFGGVYVDIDFQCIQPLDILHHCFDFYVGLELPAMALFLSPIMIQNALIGCIPDHPIVRNCIDQIAKEYAQGSQAKDIVARTGPLFFTHIVLANAGKHSTRDIILPATFLYPIDKHVKDMQTIRSLLKPETFAVHHWAGSWILKEEAFVPGIKIRCRQEGNILKFAIIDERKNN